MPNCTNNHAHKVQPIGPEGLNLIKNSFLMSIEGLMIAQTQGQQKMAQQDIINCWDALESAYRQVAFHPEPLVIVP